MSTCYFLVRRDNRTIFDLDKLWYLRQVFGDEEPILLTAGEVDEAVALALAAQRGDLDGYHDVTIHRPEPDEADRAYWRALMEEIVVWSDGKPFEFHSEHSALYEEIVMEDRRGR